MGNPWESFINRPDELLIMVHMRVLKNLERELNGLDGARLEINAEKAREMFLAK